MSHSNTIYDLQLQKTIVLRTQPGHRATLTQPLQCVSQHPVATLHASTGNTRWQQSCSDSNTICNKQIQETQRTTHTDTTTRCRTQRRRNQSRPERPQPQPPHTRGTFHRRLQPLYTGKHKVSCSGFLPNTTPMQHSCSHCHCNAFCSIPFITTSPRHHFPKSPPSLRHHFPMSPLPFVTTSHRHHFPSSPLPFLTTSHRHHSPFLTTSLPHHFPSSPLPFVTTSQSHHPPLVTASRRHHFPSSPLPFLTTSLPHHFHNSFF